MRWRRLTTATTQRFTREADFLTQTGEGGLSTWDLLEAAATVEARRLIPQAAWTSPPKAGPAFDLLVAHLGEEDAGELCAFLTFFALLTGEPSGTFASLAEAAAQQPETWKGVGAAEVLDQLDWGDEFDSYWDRVSAGEPVGTPYLAEPLREGMRRIGRSRLLELLARPSAPCTSWRERAALDPSARDRLPVARRRPGAPPQRRRAR